MKSLPLNALRAMAAVKASGGVRAAARRLGVSHSAVSRHLRELEGWLGVTLFEPGGKRQLEFTPQGDILAQDTITAFQKLERATDRIRETRSPNTVSISCRPSVAVRWLLPIVAHFEAHHPNIGLSIITNHDPETLVEQGADLSVYMGQTPKRGLSAEVLMDDTLYPVIQRQAWEAAGKPEHNDCFQHWTLLHDRDPMATWASWFERFPCKGISMATGPRFTSSDLVLRAAAQGLGIALARGRLIGDDLERGILVRPFNELEAPLPSSYWIVRDSGKPIRQVETTVINWLFREAQSGHSISGV